MLEHVGRLLCMRWSVKGRKRVFGGLSPSLQKFDVQTACLPVKALNNDNLPVLGSVLNRIDDKDPNDW